MVIHKLTVDHGLSLDVIQDIKWLYTLIVNERQDSIKQISTALLLMHKLGFFMYFILLENYNSNNTGLFTRLSTRVDFFLKILFNWIIFANYSPNIFNFN